MGQISMRRTAAHLWTAVAMVMACATGQAGAADAYPSKPVRVIVPFPAGSSPDIVARYLAGKLAERMGQPFVVDNRAGAGGMLGAEAVAKAPPDGHTMFFMVNSIVTMNQFIYKKLPYDPVKDFAPVSIVAAVPYVLIANKDFPHRTLAQLIAAARAKPASIDYASMGVGGAGHVIMELMTSLAGVRLTHVPYKSGALVDVIGGQVPLIFQPTTTAIEQVKAGTVIPLGTTGTKRLPALPDTPAIAEVVPGFEADGWQGVEVPAGTPAPIIARLNKEIAAVLALPETKTRFDALGIQARSTSPAEMAGVIAADIDKWGGVIRRAKIAFD
ncbi:MAG: tripartite tricarboxylate transporter substrate binding protein [Pigmentiphaga sp.]|uniref:Bug family tripartite tricarboxylate transporter substrate binding protein n=1 Tax=Pigmentiphaga sp. TaxID=1977564 RepID=UPI0029ABD808|nr:tripartite tricarboxylate transporter substrate binding protein [Pigmentiphaga sp.]MDX3906268.1 tripartite tricarboxylate transporter substrate binding protein [Pigmentiphaga sp.]